MKTTSSYLLQKFQRATIKQKRNDKKLQKNWIKNRNQTSYLMHDSFIQSNHFEMTVWVDFFFFEFLFICTIMNI